MRLRPGCGGDLLNLPVGHRRESGEDIAQIDEWIDSASATGFDDRVDDGAAITGRGFADEEPVLLAQSRRADGVLYPVIVDLKAAVFDEEQQAWPLTQSIVDRLADRTPGQEAASGLKSHEHAMEPCEDCSARAGTVSLSQSRSCAWLCADRFRSDRDARSAQGSTR